MVSEPQIHYAGKVSMSKIFFAVDILFPLFSSSPGEGTFSEFGLKPEENSITWFC